MEKVENLTYILHFPHLPQMIMSGMVTQAFEMHIVGLYELEGYSCNWVNS